MRIDKLPGHIGDDIGFVYKIKNSDFNALLNDQYELNMVAAILKEKIVSLYCYRAKSKCGKCVK